MIQVEMFRSPDNGIQTVSNCYVTNGATTLFSFFMLELPWKNNKRGESCIPQGRYEVEKKDPGEDGSRFNYNHFEVMEVSGRKEIKWHKGNFHHQIRGCMLPGSGLTDINGDGQLDVTNNAATLKKLWDMLPEKFPLIIKYKV